MHIHSGTIKSDFQAVDDAVEIILNVIKDKQIIRNSHLIFDINFMLREVLNNAVEHGNKFDLNRAVQFQIEFLEPLLYFKVTDEGEGFDLIKILRDESQSSILRQRHRGFQTIRELGFDLKATGNQIIITVNIEEAEHEKNT